MAEPAGCSGTPSIREIGRPEVRATGKAAGLVSVKVCAVDEAGSGRRFVVPTRRDD